MSKKEFKARSLEETTSNWGFLGRLDPVVFVISAILVVAFIIWGAFSPDSLGVVAGAALKYTCDSWGWFYLLSVLIFLLFCLFMAFSKYGSVKLGSDDEKPRYSTFTWFSMLFGAGMGVGLVFWSIAEPFYHFTGGPSYAGEPLSTKAAEYSMAISFFHWGLSAWGTFVVVGLAMGIIIYRKGLPCLISSAFYPIIGEKIYGPIGKAIDIFTLWATLFGMATTVGLGTKQLAAGLTFNYGIPSGGALYAGIMVVVVVCYLISACMPDLKGIQIGSDISMIAVLALLLFVFVLGPTKFILNLFTDGMGLYIRDFFTMSLWTDPVEQSGWLGGWTVFYWAWWIAWAPFVGMFIAKISRGRTIKEFVMGSLVAPSLFSMIYFAIFGATTVKMASDPATNKIMSDAIGADVASAIYVFFQQFPMAGLTSLIVLFVIFTFFVVSADSCTIVLGMLSTGGSEEPKIPIKIFWGVIMGLAAGICLVVGGGGINALQTASIVGALPYTMIMLVMCYCIVRFLNDEATEKLDNIKVVSGSQNKISI